MIEKPCAASVSVGNKKHRDETFDVLIRGAGPAGSVAAAWLARAGKTVALLHRSCRSPFDRIEALGPDIPSLLSQIGLDRSWLNSVAQPVPGTISRWAQPKETVFDSLMSPHGPAWSTRREIFNLALLTHAKAQGVQVVDQEVGADKVFIAVGSDNALDGQVNDKLVALTRNYDGCLINDRRLRIEAVPQGWWYALPSRGGALGLGFITDRQTIKGHSLEGIWDTAITNPILDMVQSAQKSSPLRSTPVRCSIVTSGDDRIGNARASYDPLTGRGVAEAVRNALETVSRLGQNRQAEQNRLEQHYASYLQKRTQLYELGATRFGTGFWTRRLNAITNEKA